LDLSKAISRKRCNIGGKLVLITNKKSHMSFRLVPNLILNDLGRRDSPRVCVISPNSVAFGAHPHTYKKLIRRWANVNFLYDDIVHVGLIQHTIDSCINSATNRRGMCWKLERMFTKFSIITQCSLTAITPSSPILVPIESSYTTSY